MKAFVLSFLMVVFSAQLFAAHYQQKGNSAEKQSLYIIKSATLMKTPSASPKGYYEFYSDCSGLKEAENGLQKNGLDKYVGASGRVFQIAELFAKYERRVNGGHGNMNFKSQEDADVICIVNKMGDQFTIDIYTGQEAEELLAGK